MNTDVSSDAELEQLLTALAAVPVPRRPGARVNDRVTLVRRLGGGGMGEVWVARHETLEADVAVKFTRCASAPAMRRFSREARMAAKLKCPHTVRVFDHGISEDGSPFIVMELLDGRSLREHLTRHGPLQPATVAELLRQLAKAVDEAHAAGIIHRDIKPGNVFVSGEEASPAVAFARLLDFGLARDERADNDVTRSGAAPGTPRYMAPELLIEGRPATGASDVWALGVLAYEALVGSVPFDGPTPAAIAGKMDDPPPLGALPRSLRPVLAKALAEQPQARFATAQALADAFDAALMTRPPRLRRFVPAGVTVAAVVAGVGLYFATRPPEAAPASSSAQVAYETPKPADIGDATEAASSARPMPRPLSSASPTALLAGAQTQPRARPSGRPPRRTRTPEPLSSGPSSSGPGSAVPAAAGTALPSAAGLPTSQTPTAPSSSPSPPQHPPQQRGSAGPIPAETGLIDDPL